MSALGVSFAAEPITVTHERGLDDTTHRLKVGKGNVSIYINEEVAAQWVRVLTTITAEGK